MVAKERKRDSNLVGVAVLGTGRIGGSYIDVVNQTPGAVLKVVAEQRAEAAAPWEDKYPDVEFVSDYKAVLERDDVDIVIGTLPHWLHYEAGLDAAEAGKNVFMEKPLALTSLEGRQMIDAAAANGVKLMTAHTQRYYPAVQAMKKLVDSKRLGELVMAHDMWHKPYQPWTRPPWMLIGSKGGGMGQMDGTHEIDRLMWIMGDDIETVSAQIGQVTYPRSENPDIDCDDTAMCFLRWKSGKVATISRIAWRVGATEYGGDFFFSNGMARFRLKYGNAEGQETALYVADSEEGTWKKEEIRENNPLLEEFTEYVRSIERCDDDTPIPQEHGLRVLRVFEATEESARTGREVKIDW
ncbi:MAG: Gfo/Idh/MocA family oxidoreductase [Chloroflexi bacterium]|jgi:predicted dehydrogenase|nr:Gfo/Idh/MocA family oxidoreductase [Chloroflexota bacterium]